MRSPALVFHILRHHVPPVTNAAKVDKVSVFLRTTILLLLPTIRTIYSIILAAFITIINIIFSTPPTLAAGSPASENDAAIDAHEENLLTFRALRGTVVLHLARS